MSRAGKSYDDGSLEAAGTRMKGSEWMGRLGWGKNTDAAAELSARVGDSRPILP